MFPIKMFKIIGFFAYFLTLTSSTENRFSDKDVREFLTACKRNNLETVKSFLDKGMDINTTQNQNNCILFASSFGHCSFVDFLVGKGADVNAVDRDGYSALMHAVFSCDESTILSLLENHAKVDITAKDGETAFTLGKKLPEYIKKQLITSLDCSKLVNIDASEQKLILEYCDGTEIQKTFSEQLDLESLKSLFLGPTDREKKLNSFQLGGNGANCKILKNLKFLNTEYFPFFTKECIKNIEDPLYGIPKGYFVGLKNFKDLIKDYVPPFTLEDINYSVNLMWIDRYQEDIFPNPENHGNVIETVKSWAKKNSDVPVILWYDSLKDESVNTIVFKEYKNVSLKDVQTIQKVKDNRNLT